MELIDRLIELLSQERGENPPNLLKKDKADYFRALCNVRPPKPAGEEFLQKQDEYLKQRTAERGIVEVASLNYKNNVALWQGDITRLDADAVVNACNSALLGCFSPLHNCIDNIIHSNAGVQVRLDCAALTGGRPEPNGRVKVTSAYNLPSRYIFHTVGPIVRGEVTSQNRRDLESCYISCLDKASEMRLGSLAFCCISTGVYGYPSDEACKVAVSTVKRWLSHSDYKLNVIFDVFLDKDREVYERELRG